MGLYSPDTLPRRDGGGMLPPRHRKPPPRRMRRAAGLLALALVLAGGAAAAGFLDSGGGHPAVTGAATLNARSVTGVPRPGGTAGADGMSAAALPVPVGQPVRALVPAPAVAARKAARPASGPAHPARTASPSAPAAASSSAPPVTRSPSPSPSPTAPAGAVGACGSPSFTTSAPFGSWSQGPYTVTNDMWNIGGGGISQTLSACSPGSWFVNATVPNDNGGVKTYPDSYYMFGNAPRISSLNSVTTTFAQSSPGSGTFEDAYDIWLNGTVGAANHDEVMIWTENRGQIPGGSPMTTATFGGKSYTVWRGSNNLVSFVADTTISSGTLSLLPFFQWLLAKGWEPAGSTLVQVDYGVEIVSTNGAPETFGFSDFSVSSS